MGGRLRATFRQEVSVVALYVDQLRDVGSVEVETPGTLSSTCVTVELLDCMQSVLRLFLVLSTVSRARTV